MSTVTRTIAGHEITLEAGRRYIATRPMAELGKKWYPISIHVCDEFDTVVATVPCDYDDANAFLAEFNNGRTSFDGRMWYKEW